MFATFSGSVAYIATVSFFLTTCVFWYGQMNDVNKAFLFSFLFSSCPPFGILIKTVLSLYVSSQP